MSGYLRFPTIFNNTIVFVSEDNLWQTSLTDLKAIKITSNIGPIRSPLISPDGKTIAYIGTDDGNTEIYTIPIDGGISKRVTYEGSYISNIASWKNNEIIYASSLTNPFGRLFDLRSVSCKGGQSTALKYGMANNISYNLKGTVIGKNTADPARWKRYKGGTAGKLLIDYRNKGLFKYLIDLSGNLACPMWIKDKIYFISDHNGIANIFSCNYKGKELTQHTFHKNYFARNATTDCSKIIYHAGADIFIFDTTSKENTKLNITYNSSKIATSRKFVNTEKYLERLTLNNNSDFLNIISRGKSFTLGNWNGPAIQHGKSHGTRYNHPTFLKDDKNILLTSDFNNADSFEIHSIKNNKLNKRLKSTNGRVLAIKRNLNNNQCAILNHKHELFILDISKDKITKIERSKSSFVSFNWSPCGRYIAYSCSKTSRCNIIKIYDTQKNKSHQVTDAIHNDFSPVFDPKGNYLAFISSRTFKPIYDSIQFDLNFPKSEKIYLIALNKNSTSPFIKDPRIDKSKSKDKKKKKEKIKTIIDFKNIKERIMGIPIAESILSNNLGYIKNKIFYLDWPVEISSGTNNKIKGILKYYDLDLLEEKVYAQNISDFKIFNNTIAIFNGNKVRLLDPNTIPSKEILQDKKYNKNSGLLDFSRIKLNIDPVDEWKQMFSEAWRLQRDHFWVENMSGVNWSKVYSRYYKLIDRLGSRYEFSDLLWEMQGELGTSHCYEMGGDYELRRNYPDGLLGCETKFIKQNNTYEINKLFKGDLWDNPSSPLCRPGLNIRVGDQIQKINGIKLSKTNTPGKLLVNMPNAEVELTIVNKKGQKPQQLTVKTISNDKKIIYRDWVEKNRSYVHKKSKGKIGYLHIPDMSISGYSEFHRYFLAELIYDGLIVDVRYNGGGHVSQLLLSKLARKRIGFDVTRWMGTEPYPMESPAGPMVAITNEFAGSDGDIFSHSWKLFNLGKLIGKRTWGGVIGIWPRNTLVDGTLTSQPEFAFWFKDVGWNVENYGTDVDIEVEIMPQDFQKDKDPQLDKALEIVKNDLKEKNSVLRSDFKNKPNLKLP